MSENQKQLMTDITNMIPYVNIKFVQGIKSLFETEIEQEILKINPETEFEDMDITEKLMLLSYISKSEEEKKKDEEEAIPLEECLKEAGLTIDDLQN